MNDNLNETRVIHLAGGCFWGLERLYQSIAGVVETQCGYANGSCAEDATYAKVCSGSTGFREAVMLRYDPKTVSLELLIFTLFYVIDTEARNRQGFDIGTQYQSGVYYSDEESRLIVERVAATEAGRSNDFAVEIGPLRNFFPAEEYHQDYLKKNPGGYCHISPLKIAALSKLRIDPADYSKLDTELLRQRLSETEFNVTQNSATEPPFHNEFYDFEGRGIYVDIATGEPLFSSIDKFRSSCGWPAFSRPIEPPVVVERRDKSFGMLRTEVRSRAGDSHLGHVFINDPESPNEVRYCINSASLRFIPVEKMEAEGYGYLLSIFEEK